MEYILVFDLPRDEISLRKAIHRELTKFAEMVQFSLWKSRDLHSLMKIATDIKRKGGSARILEERFVF